MTDNKVPHIGILPRLDIKREDYISKKMVDDVSEWLEDNKPDSINSMAIEETRIRVSLYYKYMGEHIVTPLINNAAIINILIPQTRLQWIDLCYELSRRWREASGLSDVPVMGKSLTSSREGTYPSLPSLPLKEWALREGLTIDMIDKVLNHSYEVDPCLWYDYVEGMRRNVLISQIHGPFIRQLHKSIEEMGLNIKIGGSSTMRGCAYERLRYLCKISDHDMNIMTAPHIYLMH